MTARQLGQVAISQTIPAAAYLVAGIIGLHFVLPPSQAALVWPAAGVALGIAFRFGLRRLLPLAAGAFGTALYAGFAPFHAVLLAASASAGAAFGAAALRWAAVRPALDRLRDVLFAVVAIMGAAAVSSLLIAAVLRLAGSGGWSGFAELWWLCWVADAMGALLVFPVIASCCRRYLWPQPWQRRLELVCVAIAVAAVSWVVYAQALPPNLAMARPLSYLVFPLMIWAAVRFRPAKVAILLLLHGAIALYFTRNGAGPFAAGPVRENLLSLHAHLAMLGVPVLALAAALRERRVAERALRDSEAKYRLLVEHQTELVVKTDAGGRIVFASPSTCELLGVPEPSILGRPLRDVAASDPTAEDACQGLWQPPYACYFEQQLDTRSGRHWLAWVAKAVLENGAVSAVVAVGRDITDRRLAEEKARRHLQELAHVGRISAMGEMAAGLAHELNQPLCAITSYSQACLRLLGKDADPELRRAIERVVANATRAAAIIGQMRAFVRKDSPEHTAADVNQMVREVAALVHPEAYQHEVVLELDLASGLPPVLVAPIQIHQVLVNLIRNGIEAIAAAASPQRAIRVRTALSGQQVEVRIEDSGPGLAPGLLAEVFEPFVSTKAGGLGLGLSISRSIIEAHGGRLFAAPRAGGGMEFRFSLPLAEQLPAQAG